VTRERYNIVSDGDLREAVTKLAAWSGLFSGLGQKWDNQL
jgi:hypothetical protein